jgi:aminoglycoside phosphotransferase (APT) family kinase protein
MRNDGPNEGSRASADPVVPVIDEQLARRLVDSQFPQWAGLPLTQVVPGGIDNRTFRLGRHLLVRLPSSAGYAPQVAKEQRWLPELAPQLPLEIPTPEAMGIPDAGYPFAWSVYRWIDGRAATEHTIADLTMFATALGEFLTALRSSDAEGAPPPGEHNYYRGGPLDTYAEETVRTIALLGGEIPADVARGVWDEAMETEWDRDPVWFHGDVAIGNLVVRAGRLVAVIDFGLCGAGDPACDLAIAWTLFDGESRDAFRAAVDIDPCTWSRGRGWALWKALITVADPAADKPDAEPLARRTIERILART